MKTQPKALQFRRKVTNSRSSNLKSPSIHISLSHTSLQTKNITTINNKFNMYININSWFNSSPSQIRGPVKST